jgi:hypothetical protein
MALQIRMVEGIDEVNHMIRGGIVGGNPITAPLLVHGLTLVFTAPSQTVTFNSGNALTPLSYLEIRTQILAQTSNAVEVKQFNGRLAVVDADLSAAVVLANTGTANALFGFSTTLSTTGRIYAAPGGTAPALVSISASGNTSSFILVTNEA